MADLPKTVFNFSGKSVVAGAGRPGKKPVKKPAKKQGSVSFSSNLVFDPSGQFSDILSDEQKARRDLYLSRVGRELEEEPDQNIALESAGLLKLGVSPADRKKLSKGGDKEFASALDALDYVGKGIGSLFSDDSEERKRKIAEDRKNLNPAQEAVKSAFDFIGDKLDPNDPDPERDRADAQIGSAFDYVGENLTAEVVPAPGTSGTQRPAGARPTYGTGGLKKTRSAQDIAFSTVGKMPFLYGSAAPESTTDYYSIEKAQDKVIDVAANPNDYIDTVRKAPIRVNDANEATNVVVESAKAGQTAANLNDLIGSDNPFSPMAELSLKGMAAQNGWDNAEWGKLTIGEKAFRAVNMNDYWALWGRSVLRGIAEMGAVLPAVKAIVDASAQALGGDTAEAQKVFEAAMTPYVSYRDTYKKRGFGAATSEFFRDNPVDAALIFVAGLKGLSTAGGITARSGAFGPRAAAFSERGRPITIKGDVAQQAPVAPEPVPLPEIPRSTGPGSARQRDWVARSERAARARAATEADNRAARAVYEEQQKAFEETGQMVDVTPDVVIGRAGRGLFGTAATQFIKAPFARRYDWYRRRLEKGDAARRQRFDTNVAQGEGIELRATITRLLGEGASELVKDRAAFNLFYPKTDADGVLVTPEYVAKFYEAELADHLEAMAARADDKGGPPTADELAKKARLESAILRNRQLEAVDIDAETMLRLREGVKPIANIVEEHMAAAMNMSLDDARRSNYIRIVAMDRKMGDTLEETAQGLYRERNEPIPMLVATQNRLQSQAKTILDKASETGWGKYGPKKSRDRFTRAYNRLLIDLDLAEKLARQNGNAELADVFAKAKADLASARMRADKSPGARADLVSGIAGLSLSPEQVARLSPSARLEYEAAQRADARATEERATEAGALEAAGLRRTDTGKVDSARVRVDDAREALSAHLALPIPDQKTVAKLQANVDKAEAALDSRVTALSAGKRASKAEGQREKRLRKAILESGRQVLDTNEVRVVLDVSERFAVMEIKGARDLFFRVDRARLETLDAFIARQVAADENPLLHLVQSQDFEDVGRALVIESDRALSRDPTAFISKGRFNKSQGYTFINALESANLWKNLLSNTIQVKTAIVLQERLDKLVQATSIRYRFSSQSLARAAQLVEETPELKAIAEGDPNAALRLALRQVLSQPGVAGRVDLENISDWVVLNIDDPTARKISGRVSYGATRKADPNADLGAFVMRTIDERSIDPNAPGDYYIMPRSVYDGIQKAIRDESFQFNAGSKLAKLDRITRLWRTITLNVLPRTAVNNTIGSVILAIQAGAGPRAFYYAWKAINGKPARIGRGERAVLPVPLELRQRYYEQLTDPLADARGAFAPMAHWMNSMRYFNGISEDFGRLAVWYHRAYPEAMRSEQGVRFFRSFRTMNDKSVGMLEAMARRDPNYELLMDDFVQQSFDFLGDLHKGGSVASTIRIAIPFWQWYAHMLKLTFITMPLKYPKRALFMQMLGEIGRDYQERMGVTVPYGESFVPFFSDVVDTPNGDQQIVGGANLANWWPQATVVPVGGLDNTSGLSGFIQGSINPGWSNGALIGLSIGSVLAGGEAKELSDRDILVSAKDEYGLPIEAIGSKAFASYVANHFFRMVPLSPTMMSLGARASNALPFPGQMEEKSYSTQQIPDEYRQAQQADVASVIDELSSDPGSLFSRDWWRSNTFNFIAKAVLGSPLNYMPGHGPMARQRILNDFNFAVQDMDKTQEAMLRVLLERHGYEPFAGKNR